MNNVTTDKTIKSAGFTLLELSIVLVIIGLIVGGVLVGQDLIKAAEIRATVGQYEKYNTAINTFRTKYDGIPGDLASDKVASFGLSPAAGAVTGAGGTGLGDGNGIIEQGTGGGSKQIGEPLLFWQQLTAASLVDGAYSTTILQTALPDVAVTGGNINKYVPPAKLGKGNYFIVGNSAGINYYLLTGFGATPIDDTDGAISAAPALNPIDAYNIDVKVDDGLPNTGATQARGTVATDALFDALAATNIGPSHTAGSEAAGDCTVGASPTNTADTYSRGTKAGTAPGCILRMRFN